MPDSAHAPASGWFEDRAFFFPLRVYYEDTDFSGIVYHANYLRFMERGRSEFLRATEISHQAMLALDEKLVWAVRRMRIDYRKPARVEEALTIRTRVIEVTAARMRLAQEVRRETEILVAAEVEPASLRLTDGLAACPMRCVKYCFPISKPNIPNTATKEENMRKLTMASITALCLAASSAFSLSDKPYITVADVDFPGLLPPPPTESSMAGKLDLQAILDMQKTMNPAREAAIQRDLPQDVYTIAGSVFGPGFTKEKFPLTGAFIDKVVKDGGVGVGPIKQKYKKLRPFQFSKDVKSAANVATATGPTYPSGHSSTAFEVALVLGMMVPEKRDALYERGWEYTLNRVASGAAYPSDAEGGHIAASLAIAGMLKNPEFRTDFESVKAELRKGLGLPS